MKIRDLLFAQPVLEKLNGQSMSGKTAYIFSKNFRLVNSELQDFQVARKKMLEDNYEFDEKNEKYIIPPDKQKEAQAMFDELLDQEVSFSPIQLSQTLLESLSLSPGEVTAIEWLIETN